MLWFSWQVLFLILIVKSIYDGLMFVLIGTSCSVYFIFIQSLSLITIMYNKCMQYGQWKCFCIFIYIFVTFCIFYIAYEFHLNDSALKIFLQQFINLDKIHYKHLIESQRIKGKYKNWCFINQDTWSQAPSWSQHPSKVRFILQYM